jgi:hypothetical protein
MRESTRRRASAPVRLAAAAALVVAVAGCSETSQNDQTPPQTWSISGTVTLSGVGLAGVTVSAAGTTRSTTTAANGTYTLAGLIDRDYTLSPSKAGYTFSPPSRTVTVSGASVPLQDFVATSSIHSISGTVSGAVTAGVTVRLTGPAPATTSVTTTTNSLGGYSFAAVQDGSYTVKPVLPGYSFTPVSRVVPLAGANATGVSFVATVDLSRSISGTVSGDASAGMTVQLYDEAGATVLATATTDDAGSYVFAGLVDGRYLVIPVPADGYTFVPENSLVTVSGVSVTGPDFTAVAHHAISGTVTGAVSAGVAVVLSGDAEDVTITDAMGAYTFPALPNGSYTVTPSLLGYRFDPGSRAVPLDGADVGGQDFAASAVFAIGGTISGDVTVGVKVSLTGAATAELTTEGTGAYGFNDVPAGVYVVTPSLAGYTFEPPSTEVTVGPTASGVDFVATLIPTYSVSGTVSGAGVEVTMTLSGSATATAKANATTGVYTFTGLLNGSYMVIPSLEGFTFDPASRTFTINGANVATPQDFAAAPAP